MTSQAILVENFGQIANQTKSNISNSENIRRTDRNSFHRVMEQSQVEQNSYKTRNATMNKVDRERISINNSINDKKAEIASKLQQHIEKNSQHVIHNDIPNTEAKPFVKEEFIEDVKDVINNVANAYKDALNIDDEELINIMEELGINLFQLPLEEVVKEIVLEANGESDITGLLVNEDALNSLKSLKEFFVSYNPEEKLDMSLEEFSNLVQEAMDRLTNLDGEVTDKSILENVDLEINLDSEQLQNNILDNQHISEDKLSVENITDTMLNEDVNVEDNRLNNQVIQDDSTILSNIDNTYNKSENTNDVLMNMDEQQSSKEMVNNNSVTITSEIEVSENKKISVEITKSADTTTNQDMDVKLVDSQNTKEVNSQLNNVLDNKITSQELALEGADNTVDTLENEIDKGINNDDVNEYVSERKDSLVANKPSGESTPDMMSEGNETQTKVIDSNKQIDNKEAAVEFYDKFIANLEKSLGVGEGDMLNEMSHVKEMREVVEQLVDKIKVNINKDTTIMKMQLAPEHLGKLELEITSKSGILTASIKVENAVAKEAIENGLQTLIQKFDEQGVKVEAVEVSIANYDMSKENGREKSSQDYEMEIKKKKRHGKISVDELNAVETEEDLHEEKQLRSSLTSTTIDYAV